LNRNNEIITKGYCEKFYQELVSDKPSLKFRYNEEVLDDLPENIWNKLSLTSLLVLVVRGISSIVFNWLKMFGLFSLSLGIVATCLICFPLLMYIGDRVDEKRLYGK